MAKAQSAAGQLAGDTCFSPILSLHSLRLREGKGPYLRSQSVLGGDRSSNPGSLVATQCLFPLNLSTSWFEARLKFLGDFLKD